MAVRPETITLWFLRVVAAIIMLQTLFFKFAGDPESIHIFSSLGMEPWGRYGIGILELVASVLLLMPRTTGLGALLGLALMSGAIYFHLYKIGIVVQNDHGQLFTYACLVFICCVILVYVNRRQLLHAVKRNRP
jgi:uncharacterized membrane protein YphA (DoxX/SURF4 family)